MKDLVNDIKLVVDDHIEKRFPKTKKLIESRNWNYSNTDTILKFIKDINTTYSEESKLMSA